jgi:hypothetical protein
MYNEEDDVSDLQKMFDKFDSLPFAERDFERIPEPDRRHPMRDLCGMIYLYEKIGGKGDIIKGAEHDVIHLADEDECGDKLSEADVLYLSRCGIFLGEYGLQMYA